MFFSALLKAAALLSFVISFHAVLVWMFLLQPKPIPVKTLQRPVQVSFIQLQKPTPTPVKMVKAASRPVAVNKPKSVKKINKKPRKSQSKKKQPKTKTRQSKKALRKSNTTKQITVKSTHNTNPSKTVKKTEHKTASNANQDNKAGKSVSKPLVVTVPKKIRPRFNQAYLHQPKPPYTRILRRLNAQGTVKLRIIFAKQGQVKQVSIVSSSGSTRLDNHAMQYVKKHWRYNPPEKQQQWATVILIRFYLQ
ncbi:TonB family protein [Candidatus Albibeggiatoa sp. nov. BB20]|uniref:energy transducer TonB n=1 Tax=Candidatus Albibeggiatoa sp. nov. BB20 TaxID=3162723 RepID=UPI0033655783